jgi:hypothetical protein
VGTVNADGGVDYCLYRKDRVKIAQGAHHPREYRLKPESPTRRVAASCCGSPMFLDFKLLAAWAAMRFRRPKVAW